MNRRSLLGLLPLVAVSPVLGVIKKPLIIRDTYKGWKLHWEDWFITPETNLLYGRWTATKPNEANVAVISCCPGAVGIYRPFDWMDTYPKLGQIVLSRHVQYELGEKFFEKLKEDAKRQTFERLIDFLDKVKE